MEAAEQKSPGFLSLRLTLGLGAMAALYALVIAWSISASSSIWPFGGTLNLRYLPQVLCAVAALFAVLSPPSLQAESSARREFSAELSRILFAALWQAAVAALFLSLAARLTPLSTSAILKTAIWIALAAFTAQLFFHLVPQRYGAISFCWLFAMPTLAFFLAEIFLMSPAGGNAWLRTSGPAAETLRSIVHTLLTLSPATSASGALTGILADGSTYDERLPLSAFAGLCAGLLLLAWMKNNRLQSKS
ncbi:MAG TPA: hypothetical protein VEK08_15350 [Planctomycetota bacterium]|nr:hypothetical protein [Planctomycetota bacterium]